MKTFFTSIVKAVVIISTIFLTYSASAQGNKALAFNNASFIKSETSFIQLEWTSPKDDVEFFKVERSLDGKEYKQCAMVFASDENQFTDYKFRDKEISSEVPFVYYRIGVVYDNKEVKYMEAKRVKIIPTATASLKLSIYPNPVTSSSIITLPEEWKNGDVKLQIFTMEGRIVRTMIIPEARLKMRFITHNLQRGNYILKAFCNNQTIETQIVRE